MMRLVFELVSGVVAVGVGSVFFGWFEPWLRKQSGLLRPDPPPKGKIPAEITGAIERFVFGCAFALVPAGEAGTGALAWLTLKQIPFWQQPIEGLSLSGRDEHPHRAAQSLLMSFVSLALAAAVGLVFHELAR
jgi:hypothetical protein